MLISTPTNFDFNILKKLKNKIYDTYGNLNRIGESIVSTYALPAVSFKKFGKYIEYSHKMGIKFNYIMSHPGLELDKETISLLNKLNKMEVDIVTVSNQRLITFIKKEYPFKICSSIICKIDSLERVMEYKSLGCDIICLDYSKNSDLEFIKLVKSNVDVKIKLLANNICLPGCPYSEEHFREGEYLDKASIKCLRLRLNDAALIRKTGFIHPNCVKKYEEAGVDFLKLGGRTKPAWWIINCTMAYFERSYQGNSFRLMNTLGTENKYPAIIRNFLMLFPDSFIRCGFKLLHFLTNKRILKILSKQENIKPLLRIYLSKDFFYIDDKDIFVDRKDKEYLLREIDKILG